MIDMQLYVFSFQGHYGSVTHELCIPIICKALHNANEALCITELCEWKYTTNFWEPYKRVRMWSRQPPAMPMLITMPLYMIYFRIAFGY